MKKILALLLIFAMSAQTGYARDVMVQGADGTKKEVMGHIKEPAINDDRILIDDFEDGDFKNRLDGDGGGWDMDPIEEFTSCQPEIIPMLAPEMSENVLRLTYDIDSPHPAQNGYWMKLKNVDATEYDHLEFFVRGDMDAGFTTKFKIEIKKYTDEKREDRFTAYEVVEGVTQKWQKIKIPLTKFNAILDWKNLDEMAIVFHDKICDKLEGVLYFDNFRFVKTGYRGPDIYSGRGSKIRKTYNDYNAKEWGQFLAARLRGYPEKVFVEKEFPEDDREFLMQIAKDTWGFFDNIVDKDSHLPLDTISLAKEGVHEDGAYVGDYTNVTNIGMYLVCLVAGYELGFISKEEAMSRVRDTLSTIMRLETYNNFHFNYYDTTTMEATDNLVSLIDSGWLAIGVMVVRQAFKDDPKLVKKATALIESWDFGFFYDEVSGHYSHGYYRNIDGFKDYNYGPFYSEPRIVSYIGVARGDVPFKHWTSLFRTFPEDFTWQEQTPINRVEKEWRGEKYFGGYYEYEGKKYIPAWGGSLFEALMPAIFLKEKDLAPEGLGANNAAHSAIHVDYTLNKLEYPVWGMSPSTVPAGGYSEFGVKPLGSKGYHAGVVTPHASILAIDYETEAVIKNLRTLIEKYDIYGEYGFYDAVNPETGLVSLKYLCLDQGMIFLALCNYLMDGIIREHFHSDPQMKAAEYLLTEEKLFE